MLMTMDASEVEATVMEVLPSNIFRLALDDEREVLAYLSGKMVFNHIRLLLGDRVRVVLDPYKGTATNRITRRL